MRLGLRYVNELKFDGEASTEDLADLLSEEVLGPIKLARDTEGLERSWQELRLRLSDQRGCTMQHGYVQNAEQQWVYVLDFDGYREGKRELNAEEQVKALAGINHYVFDLFQGSVTPETFHSFEPEEKEK